MADETVKAAEIVKPIKEENPFGKDVKDNGIGNLSDVEAHRGDSGKESKIDLLLDLNLNVSVELGKRR